jgi:hypothetical protein
MVLVVCARARIGLDFLYIQGSINGGQIRKNLASLSMDLIETLINQLSVKSL